MSTDGMIEGPYSDNPHHHSTNTETEEEYAVIDRGEDYKLSIMRKKRPLMVAEETEPPKKDTGEFV